MAGAFEICRDDLSGAATRALLALHLSGMHANSPPGSVFALDLSGLLAPEVTVWSVREGEAVLGIGALKALGDGTGELKSMRTDPGHLRRNRSSAALLPLGRTDVLGRPWSGVFELSLWMTLPTTRRVSSGGSSC